MWTVSAVLLQQLYINTNFVVVVENVEMLTNAGSYCIRETSAIKARVNACAGTK